MSQQTNVRPSTHGCRTTFPNKKKKTARESPRLTPASARQTASSAESPSHPRISGSHSSIAHSNRAPAHQTAGKKDAKRTSQPSRKLLCLGWRRHVHARPTLEYEDCHLGTVIHHSRPRGKRACVQEEKKNPCVFEVGGNVSRVGCDGEPALSELQRRDACGD